MYVFNRVRICYPCLIADLKIRPYKPCELAKAAKNASRLVFHSAAATNWPKIFVNGKRKDTYGSGFLELVKSTYLWLSFVLNRFVIHIAFYII